MLVRLFGRRQFIACRQARHLHNVREPKGDPRWPGYEVVIGIETHAQLKSRQKLFSRMSLAAMTSTVVEESNRRVDIRVKG